MRSACSHIATDSERLSVTGRTGRTLGGILFDGFEVVGMPAEKMHGWEFQLLRCTIIDALVKHLRLCLELVNAFFQCGRFLLQTFDFGSIFVDRSTVSRDLFGDILFDDLQLQRRVFGQGVEHDERWQYLLALDVL